jgi:hypothetical protein
MNYWVVLRGKREIKFLEIELEFKICTKSQTQNYYNGLAMCERQNTVYQEYHGKTLKKRKDNGKTEENDDFSSTESYKITFWGREVGAQTTIIFFKKIIICIYNCCVFYLSNCTEL